MDEAWRQQIRERALAIWKREGSPDGGADRFDAMAEQELLAEGQMPSSSPLDEHPEPPRDEAKLDEIGAGGRSSRLADSICQRRGTTGKTHADVCQSGRSKSWVRSFPAGGRFTAMYERPKSNLS